MHCSGPLRLIFEGPEQGFGVKTAKMPVGGGGGGVGGGNLVLAHNADPDQLPHDVASDLGLHCLPMTLLRVFR